MHRFLALIAAVGLIAGAQQAQAHEIDISIIGFQYTFTVSEIPPEFGPAGYISTPAGALSTGGTASGDTIGSVTNRDVVPHTFTECTADCDQPEGSYAGAAFDFEVAPDTTVVTSSIPVGTYTVMCKIHPWMRASVRASGA